jgi:ribose transport system ATP-binding protein
MSGTILEMKGICKSFPGVKALQDVDFDLRAGEVHALVGENGAGKSTLMKILSGVYRPDAGEIRLHSKVVSITSPLVAQAHGISIIHQERRLFPALSAAENVFAGRLPRTSAGLVDWERLNRQAKEYLDLLGFQPDVRTPVGELSVANQQLVEIAKALSMNPKIIIMDEPTAPLTDSETEQLFAIIRQLKARHVAVVYISHRLDELRQICDRVTILRDGRRVGHHLVAEVSNSEIVQAMVGREIVERFPKVVAPRGPLVLRVKDLSQKKRLKNISFEIHRGEMVGLAGLVGAGRTELARCLFGVDPFDQGEIEVAGEPRRIRSIQDALKAGIALAVEDRKRQGLVLSMSVRHNVTLASLEKISRLGWLRLGAEQEIVQKQVRDLAVKTPHIDQLVGNLSGGNQQKVVLAKWLAKQFDVLILDEPTIGIDVGSRVELYELINDLAKSGVGILLISSDLPEVLGMSDRILVMREGSLVADLERGEATQELIMQYATGSVDARVERCGR